ncbi:unnamed protein product [Discosporangium mesarthrocarpum]
MREGDIAIDVLELLAMVVIGWIVSLKFGDAPVEVGEQVLMREDNMAAAQGVKKCKGPKDSRAAHFMRLLGVLELVRGWCPRALHISGVSHILADDIFREGETLRPLTREMLYRGRHMLWGLGEKGMVLWLGLCLSFIFMSRALEDTMILLGMLP